MEITKEILSHILDAYAYEVVFADRNHIVQYMNKAAKKRYAGRIDVGGSLFNCHNENSRAKIEEFLRRAENGEEEMFEAFNPQKQEREFFVPVKDDNGHVIGYFERHEVNWSLDDPKKPVTEYWKHHQ